tara:strand:+ start:7962 stop:8165 length:204 start_codon:yes stop_codon:yes gene_type:complete
MISARQELTYCASDADKTESERVNPAAAAMEPMTGAYSSGKKRGWDIKDELNRREDISTVHYRSFGQ